MRPPKLEPLLVDSAERRLKVTYVVHEDGEGSRVGRGRGHGEALVFRAAECVRIVGHLATCNPKRINETIASDPGQIWEVGS